MNKISYLFISLVVLINFDYLTTYIAICNYGAVELNPLYRMCENIGTFFIIKTIITAIGVYILYYYKEILKDNVCKTLVVLNGLYGFVIVSNSNQLYHYFI